MLIGANSDEILGFTAFGFEASEPMAAVQTAMIGRMPFTMLRDAIFTHPTMSEGLIALLGERPREKRATVSLKKTNESAQYPTGKKMTAEHHTARRANRSRWENARQNGGQKAAPPSRFYEPLPLEAI